MSNACRLIAVLIGLIASLAMSSEQNHIEAFPEAEPGMVRHVITLPEMSRPDENYSVELVAGRTILTDGVNVLRMDTALNPHPLEGWGFTYYRMTGEGRVASTLMAPPEGAPEVEAFVAGSPLTVRYNSRLPVVIYAPEGFEIRYRIWAAADEYLPAGPG